MNQIKLTKTILMFQSILKNNPKKARIVFPEGWNKKIKNTVLYLVENNLCIPILLVKDEKEIDPNLAKNKNIKYQIINEEIKSKEKQVLANSLFHLRKHKGLTYDDAFKLLGSTNYYGTMLVKEGYVDGYVGGIEYSTKDTLKPALQIVKTNKNSKIVGDFFLLERANERYLFVNCAVILDPSASQLVDLAYNAYSFMKMIGINKPKVAFLSYSTSGSGKGSSPDKVREAINLCNTSPKYKNFNNITEMQFDAAFDVNVRIKKAPQIKWQGPADIYVFPNLDSGNIGYKIAQRLGNFTAIGPILCGLAKPINDLSRGSTLNDIISTVITTSLMVIKGI